MVNVNAIGWVPEKLGDLVSITTGKLDSNAAKPDGRYPFFTCSRETFRTDTYSFDCECVLLAGNNAAGIYPIKYFHGRFDAYQRTYVIRTSDSDHLNNRFLYYLLKPQLDFLKSISTGAATKFLTLTILKDLPLLIPPLTIQARIAAILSAYDDLIENNLRRIKILGEMAQSLYREWFVRFRFPGHEKVRMVDSPAGNIPEGWEVVALEDLISHHIGGGWGKEILEAEFKEQAWVIRGTDIPEARLCQVDHVPHRFHTPSNLRSRFLHTGDIVFEVSGGSKDQLLGRTLLISKELLSAFSGESVICASFCKLIRPDPAIYGPELMFLSFLHGYESGEIAQFQVQSTGISNFKWTQYIQQTRRIVPPKPIQIQFQATSEPLLAQIGSLGLKVRNLRQTRDLLLPKLISGEVDVSELGIAVPEEAEA